jgi:hypothetical protein
VVIKNQNACFLRMEVGFLLLFIRDVQRLVDTYGGRKVLGYGKYGRLDHLVERYERLIS